MTDFTFITANDIHISDQGPRSRTDNFKESILSKIAQMGSACNKLNADAALIAGDLFNLKTPTRNSHNLNQELIKEFGKFKCPIYMIPGNHDLTANRLGSLPDQPLGVLFADKTLINLNHEVIEKDGHKVSLVGIPFQEKLDLNTLNIPENKGYLLQICLMHIYASPKGGMLFEEKLYGYDELTPLSPDIFVLGHYHVDQGIKEVGGKSFINIGSLSRGTLTDEEINHQPQIGYIKVSVDDEGNIQKAVQAIKLKVKPASEVFDLEKREEEKKESEEIQLFVDKLMDESGAAILNSGTESEDLSSTVNEMTLAKDVKEKVFYFLQEAAAKK